LVNCIQVKADGGSCSLWKQPVTCLRQFCRKITPELNGFVCFNHQIERGIVGSTAQKECAVGEIKPAQFDVQAAKDLLNGKSISHHLSRLTCAETVDDACGSLATVINQLDRAVARRNGFV